MNALDWTAKILTDEITSDKFCDFDRGPERNVHTLKKYKGWSKDRLLGALRDALAQKGEMHRIKVQEHMGWSRTKTEDVMRYGVRQSVIVVYVKQIRGVRTRVVGLARGTGGTG